MQKAFIFMIITLVISSEVYADQNMNETPVDPTSTIVGTWEHRGLVCVPTDFWGMGLYSCHPDIETLQMGCVPTYPVDDLPLLPVHNPAGYGSTEVTFAHNGTYEFRESMPEEDGGCESRIQGSYSIILEDTTLNQRYSPDYEMDTDCMKKTYRKDGLNPEEELRKRKKYMQDGLELLSNVYYDFVFLNEDTLYKQSSRIVQHLSDTLCSNEGEALYDIYTRKMLSN